MIEQLKISKVYLIGDININLSPAIDAFNDSSNVNGANDYVNMLASNGYFPLITLPTRVTSVSSIINDHLITNELKNIISPDIIKTDLTDHYPIFCFINAVTCSYKTNQKLFRRNFLNFNAEDFYDDLHKALAIFSTGIKKYDGINKYFPPQSIIIFPPEST